MNTIAYALRRIAQRHKWAGRNNEPGLEDSATESAEAVVRDAFIALAQLLEHNDGVPVTEGDVENYERLKEDQR